MSAFSRDESFSEALQIGTSPHARVTILAKLLQQRNEIDGRISVLKMLTNSAAPINRLPVEILVSVFRTVQADSYADQIWQIPEDRLDLWYPLVGVCRHWRTIALATPLLWREIHVGTKPHLGLFRLFLRRSAKTLLEVSFSATYDVEPFLEELANHRHRLRVRTLEFTRLPRYQCTAVSDFLSAEAPGDMPSLESLKISFGKHGCELFSGPELPEELYGNRDHLDHFPFVARGVPLVHLKPEERQYPRLKTLSLRNVALDNASALAPSLTTLVLSNAICEDVRLIRLLYFMKACKTLKSLTLKNYRYDDPGLRAWIRDGSDPLPHVALPATFSYLAIEDVGPYIARFLSALLVPATASIAVTRLSQYNDGGDEFDDDDPDYTPGTVAACLPKVRVGLPLLASATHADIQLREGRRDGGESEFWGRLREAHLKIAPRGRGVDVRHDFLGIFGGAPLTELKISSVLRGELSATDWASILGAFPLLRRLAVSAVHCWGTDRTMHDLLAVLALRQPGGGAMCPGLTDLAVAVGNEYEDASVARALAVCLEARKPVANPLARLRIGMWYTRRIYPPMATPEQRLAQYAGPLRDLVEQVEGVAVREWDSVDDFWGGRTTTHEGSVDVADGF